MLQGNIAATLWQQNVLLGMAHQPDHGTSHLDCSAAVVTCSGLVLANTGDSNQFPCWLHCLHWDLSVSLIQVYVASWSVNGSSLKQLPCLSHNQLCVGCPVVVRQWIGSRHLRVVYIATQSWPGVCQPFRKGLESSGSHKTLGTRRCMTWPATTSLVTSEKASPRTLLAPPSFLLGITASKVYAPVRMACLHCS